MPTPGDNLGSGWPYPPLLCENKIFFGLVIIVEIPVPVEVICGYIQKYRNGSAEFLCVSQLEAGEFRDIDIIGPAVFHELDQRRSDVSRQVTLETAVLQYFVRKRSGRGFSVRSGYSYDLSV